MAQIVALVSNRTLQVMTRGSALLSLLVPSSSFNGWHKELASENDAKHIPYRELLHETYHDKHVIVTDLPPNPTDKDKHALHALQKYLRRAHRNVSSDDVVGCLAAEFIRPGPAVRSELDRIAQNFREKISIAVHLRVSDWDMAVYMGNPTALSMQNSATHHRKLGLDYTGAARRKSGCITDFTWGGCIYRYHDVLQRHQNKSVVYFVAADSISNVKRFEETMSQKNASIFRSPGHPIHTGRPTHTERANETHGAKKALLDFLLLASADYFVGNCPVGGSSFTWNVYNMRLRASSALGLGDVCAKVSTGERGVLQSVT